MKIKKFVLGIFLVCVQGCGVTDRGFCFNGQYEATKSGFRILLISKGYVQPGDDLAHSAAAAVTICPTSEFRGKLIQLTLTAISGQWIKVDCDALGIVSEDLKSSEALLTTLLSRSGYVNLAPNEIQGSGRVIINSLAGPKGVILEGQIESLRVVHTDIKYGYDLKTSDPPGSWIDRSEFLVCD